LECEWRVCVSSTDALVYFVYDVIFAYWTYQYDTLLMLFWSTSPLGHCVAITGSSVSQRSSSPKHSKLHGRALYARKNFDPTDGVVVAN